MVDPAELRADARAGSRRLGSLSLLEDVVAQSLEPEYADRARSGAGRPPPPVRARRAATLTGAVGLAVLGLILGVGAWNTHADAPVVSRTRGELAGQVRSATAQLDDLDRRARQLRRDAATLRTRALSADGVGADAAAALAAAESASGATALTGPGVRVTLDDTASDDPASKITDRDLQRLVNGLWASGAEAVAVDGVRLTARSSIRTAGEAILVDFRAIAAPYEVLALGDAATVQTTFGRSAEAGDLRGLASAYGLTFRIETATELTVPEGGGLTVRLAEPKTTLPASTPSSARTPDPGSAPGASPDSALSTSATDTTPPGASS